MHWLFQAGSAFLERHGGFRALDVAKVLLVVAAFGAALGVARARGSPVAGAVLAVPGIVSAQERFTLRPEIVSFALLGSLLLILERRERSPRILWAVPPLLALWANVHSLFAVGLAVLLLVLAGETVDHGLGMRPAPRRLAIVAALAVPCTLLTPYGFSGWSLTRTLLFERIATGNLYGQSIAEFQAPFGGFGRTASIAALAILIALVLLVIGVGHRACRAADGLLLAAFLL